MMDAYWNLYQRTGPAPGVTRFPALLKIDVDNGDCDFLRAWMRTGYRPLVIDMEVPCRVVRVCSDRLCRVSGAFRRMVL